MTEFQGQVALVTGAAGGIGSAVVRALAEQGAAVAATDANEPAVTELAHTLAAQGHRVHGHRIDVRKSSEVDSVLDAVGPLDILVNAAGVLSTATAVDTTAEQWQTLFDINVGGVFTVSTAVARRMMAARRGAIITVSSNAGGVPRMNMSAYAASKAAATSFTKSLGLELAQYGIRCNVVAPGSTNTPMLRGMWASDRPEQRYRLDLIEGSLETFKTGIPLGRTAEPEDIADAVVFLASSRARHITMQDLYVDGGATLRG
jgi:2,3-dihydro-2,3-dihydroxybenzoate dehydrogenase